MITVKDYGKKKSGKQNHHKMEKVSVTLSNFVCKFLLMLSDSRFLRFICYKTKKINIISHKYVQKLDKFMQTNSNS